MNTPTLVGYLTVRRAIGFLGIGFPLVLWAGTQLLCIDEPLQKSLSHYYHTSMRDVFVGMLCAIAVFLFAYRGYKRATSDPWWQLSDNVAANLAGLFALGVALCPVAQDGSNAVECFISRVHYFCAFGLFIMLAYICLALFAKSKCAKRRRVFRACGSVILVATALIALCSSIQGDSDALVIYKPVFWLESVAVIAFGVSWLVKGIGLRSQSPTAPPPGTVLI